MEGKAAAEGWHDFNGSATGVASSPAFLSCGCLALFDLVEPILCMCIGDAAKISLLCNPVEGDELEGRLSENDDAFPDQKFINLADHCLLFSPRHHKVNRIKVFWTEVTEQKANPRAP